jgi:CRP/FNR family transcriptional regulator
MPLVFSGSINILRQDDHGNEVLLYYLEKGKTCAMSMSCCMKEKKSNIWAIAEEDTQLLLVPVEKILQLEKFCNE